MAGSPVVLPSEPCARVRRNQNEKGFPGDLDYATCLAAGQTVVVAAAPAAALEKNAPFEAG